MLFVCGGKPSHMGAAMDAIIALKCDNSGNSD